MKEREKRVATILTKRSGDNALSLNFKIPHVITFILSFHDFLSKLVDSFDTNLKVLTQRKQIKRNKIL